MPGSALLKVAKKLATTVDDYSGDIKTGVNIVLKALKEPIRQIATNAGLEGSIIVEKVLSNESNSFGFNAATDQYVDMIEEGIIDPTKVTRSALQNAASIAAMLLTTESVVAEDPEKNKVMPAGGAPGGMPGMY